MLKRRNMTVEPEAPLAESNKQVSATPPSTLGDAFWELATGWHVKLANIPKITSG